VARELKRLDVLVDGGAAPGGAPSTIVAVRDDEVSLVRAGTIAWERVLESLESA
jgi:tRNA A37 threonylcarbamoyladenosine synthetase subunit TsaC/SUA5/YrdC